MVEERGFSNRSLFSSSSVPYNPTESKGWSSCEVLIGDWSRISIKIVKRPFGITSDFHFFLPLDKE